MATIYHCNPIQMDKAEIVMICKMHVYNVTIKSYSYVITALHGCVCTIINYINAPSWFHSIIKKPSVKADLAIHLYL